MTYKNKVLIIILLITPLFGLGIDLYSPSMPVIADYFKISEPAVKMTIIVYLIGYGVGQIIFGPLSDRYGRKIILMLGLTVYIVITVMLSLTDIPSLFLIGRFAQGFFISSAGVINKTLLSDNFSEKNLEKATAYMVIVWAIGPIVAPAIGSYVQEYFSWKLNFWLLCFYGVLSLVLTKIFLIENRKTSQTIMYKKIISDYIEVLTNRSFIGLSFLVTITYTLLVVFSIAGPFVIQVYLQHSVIEYGHLALVMGLGFFVGTIINRILITHFQARGLIYVNIGLSVLVSLIMLCLNIAYPLTISLIGIPTFLIIFFSAIITPNGYALSLKLFVRKAGTATAVRGTITLIGASILASPIILLESASCPWMLAAEYSVLSIMAFIIFYRMVGNKVNKQNSRVSHGIK